MGAQVFFVAVVSDDCLHLFFELFVGLLALFPEIGTAVDAVAVVLVGVVFVVEGFLQGENLRVFLLGGVEAGHLPAEVLRGLGHAQVVGLALFGRHDGFEVALLLLLQVAEFFSVGGEREALRVLLNVVYQFLIVLLNLLDLLALFGGQKAQALVLPTAGQAGFIGSEKAFRFVFYFALKFAHLIALGLGHAAKPAILLTRIIFPPRFVGIIGFGLESFEAIFIAFPKPHLNKRAHHIVGKTGGAENITEGFGVVGVEGGDQILSGDLAVAVFFSGSGGLGITAGNICSGGGFSR